MPPDLPKHLTRQQRSIESQIREAFKGVTRDRGVSWSEAEVIDLYGSPEERKAARNSDRDTHWEQLVEDPKWQHEVGVGGFTFLDAIGFRYYLPAAMIRYVRNCTDFKDRLAWQLEVNSDLHQSLIAKITDPQALVIARFLLFMNAALSKAHGVQNMGQSWLNAYNSHWRSKHRGTPLDEI